MAAPLAFPLLFILVASSIALCYFCDWPTEKLKARKLRTGSQTRIGLLILTWVLALIVGVAADLVDFTRLIDEVKGEEQTDSLGDQLALLRKELARDPNLSESRKELLDERFETLEKHLPKTERGISLVAILTLGIAFAGYLLVSAYNEKSEMSVAKQLKSEIGRLKDVDDRLAATKAAVSCYVELLAKIGAVVLMKKERFDSFVGHCAEEHSLSPAAALNKLESALDPGAQQSVFAARVVWHFLRIAFFERFPAGDVEPTTPFVAAIFLPRNGYLEPVSCSNGLTESTRLEIAEGCEECFSLERNPAFSASPLVEAMDGSGPLEESWEGDLADLKLKGAGSPPVRSIIMEPIRSVSHEKPIGVLFVFSGTKNALTVTEDRRPLLEVLTNEIGMRLGCELAASKLLQIIREKLRPGS